MKHYMEIANNYALLTQEQEQDLAQKIVGGDESAVKELVCANLRLVVKIARDFMGMGVDFKDLVQAGNTGLMTAARKFKPGYKSRFSTFAQNHIKHGIKDVLCKLSGAVSFSIGTHGRYRKIKEALEDGGTIQEVARKCNRSVKAVRDVLCGGNTKISLSQKVSNDDERTYEDIVSDNENETSFADAMAMDERMSLMFECLDNLDEQERYVIESIFGLNDKKPKVLHDIGKELNLTAERVRQIKNSALLHLKEGILEMEGEI